METVLTSAGIRPTARLRGILAVLKREKNAWMTHSEISEALIECGVHMDRVTLYRLLKRLNETSLIARVVDSDRCTRFSAKPHEEVRSFGIPQFRCSACHRQFSLPTLPIGLEKVIADATAFFKQAGHHSVSAEMMFSGTCSHCINKSGSTNTNKLSFTN